MEFLTTKLTMCFYETDVEGHESSITELGGSLFVLLNNLVRFEADEIICLFGLLNGLNNHLWLSS
jgi:hypothetical protein